MVITMVHKEYTCLDNQTGDLVSLDYFMKIYNWDDDFTDKLRLLGFDLYRCNICAKKYIIENNKWN